MPVEELLRGDVGTLAPLAAADPKEARKVVQRMKQRLEVEVSSAEAATLWAETKVLLGLRYPRAIAAQLLRGVHHMKESDTYQEILEEGATQALHETLLQLGRIQFGPPDERTRACIEGISDVPRLQELTVRLLRVKSWQELLAEPRPKRRNGRKRKP
jgi:predicted transposase YdaD